MTTEKKRKEYIDSLYSKKEQKQIAKSIKDWRLRTTTIIEDYLLLDERYRLLKKHFKLTDKQESEIIDKLRVPSNGEEELLKILHGN